MKASEELKNELKEITFEKLLNKSNFICTHLRNSNEEEFQEFKNFKYYAKDYAPEYYSGHYSWWSTITAIQQNNLEYLLKEKIRFINDILEDKFVENS